MTLDSILFFLVYNIFSTICISMLIHMITLKTTIKILLNSLIFILFNGLILIMLGLDFLGIVYILVYAGAILVLFLSVLMLVNLRYEETAEVKESQDQDPSEMQFLNFLKVLAILVYFFSNTYVYLLSCTAEGATSSVTFDADTVTTEGYQDPDSV